MTYEDCPGGSACSVKQRCPKCSLIEAHGSYCTRCGTRTTPADWFKNELSDARKAALERARNTRSVQKKANGDAR